MSQVLAANAAYAEQFADKAALALPPARRVRASDDAIRSLVIARKLLGMHEWFVVHPRS